MNLGAPVVRPQPLPRVYARGNLFVRSTGFSGRRPDGGRGGDAAMVIHCNAGGGWVGRETVQLHTAGPKLDMAGPTRLGGGRPRRPLPTAAVKGVNRSVHLGRCRTCDVDGPTVRMMEHVVRPVKMMGRPALGNGSTVVAPERAPSPTNRRRESRKSVSVASLEEWLVVTFCCGCPQGGPPSGVCEPFLFTDIEGFRPVGGKADAGCDAVGPARLMTTCCAPRDRIAQKACYFSRNGETV